MAAVPTTTTTTTTTTSPTFGIFPQLPPDLRLRIWELALRPLIPVVHFFPQCSPLLSGPYVLKDASPRDGEGLSSSEAQQQQQQQQQQGKEEKKEGGEGQAETQQASNANRSIASIIGRSAHLWDSGLWEACHESHHVVRRHYHEILGPPTFAGQPPSNIPWIASLNPVHDLLCLSPAYPYYKTGSPSKDWIHNNFRNIALLIDDSWPLGPPSDDDDDDDDDDHDDDEEDEDDDDDEEDEEDEEDEKDEDKNPANPRSRFLISLLTVALGALPSANLPPDTRFWLIDPDIQLLPNHAQLWNLDGRARFHGLDCVFVETVREICAPPRRGRNTAFDFYDQIQETTESWLRDERHFLGSNGVRIDACELCRNGSCPLGKFKLHDVVGVLAPMRVC